jgi:serine/threonine protein kinase
MAPFQDDLNHPDYPGQNGTLGYRAPEQCLRSAEWKTPLNGQRQVEGGLGDAEYCRRTILESADGYGIRYGAKVNLWAIGNMMRDLYYLHDGKQYDESTFDAFGSEEQEERYRKYGYNMCPVDELPEGPPDYSPLLLAHIDRCMALDADVRLSAAEELQNAKAGLQDCIQTIRDKKYGPDHKLVRLAFRGNEINNLP